MSPRPRKVTDEEILLGTMRAMRRLGPGELTLAEIGEECGVTAGALVQRFGSKRALLLELARQAAASGGGMLAGVRARHASPLSALRAWAECMGDLAATPAAFGRNLAYLQIDLTDADFRGHLMAQARETRAGFEALLREAVAARELRPSTDVKSLARLIETVLSGSLMTWATYRDGAAARWLLADVDRALAPWRSR